VNPVVLIVSHERQRITCANIDSLLKQTVVPRIVLTVSRQDEYIFYRQAFPTIEVLRLDNEPLGAKWHWAVKLCERYSPDPLILTGSDDLLALDYVERCCLFMQNNPIDFMGLQQWYILDPHTGVLYHFKYRVAQPLGGGRAYSGKLLEKLQYDLFETAKAKKLDDYGYLRTGKSKRYVMQQPFILAVKGDWPVMNPLAKTLKHPNARLLAKYSGDKKDEILKQFGYG
jgi:hypothetical protein